MLNFIWSLIKYQPLDHDKIVYWDDDNLFVHPEWQLRQQCPEIWQTLSLSPQVSVERSPGQTWLHPRPRSGGGDSWSAPPRQAGPSDNHIRARSPSDNQTRARRTSKNVDEQPTIGSVYGGGGVNLKRAFFFSPGKGNPSPEFAGVGPVWTANLCNT